MINRRNDHEKIFFTQENNYWEFHMANKKQNYNHTKRTSGEDYIVKNTTSRVLRKLDVGSFKDKRYKGEKIPFLKEMIATVPPGKKLVVELKCGSEVLPYLKKVVKKSGKQDRLVFINFGWQTILDTKKIFPSNKCYWLCSKKEELTAKVHEAARNKLDGLDLYTSIIDAKTMELAKELKLDVIAWTIDDPVEAKRLIGLGVKGITTIRPSWLKERLRKI